MGTNQSTEKERLREINKDIDQIRKTLKISPKNFTQERKEATIKRLTDYSNEITHYGGKVDRKKRENILQTISVVLEEVINVDPTSLENPSIVDELPRSRTNSVGTTATSIHKKSKMYSSNGRNSVASLRAIEEKTAQLKNDINTAINNKNAVELRVHKQAIEIMAKDLESIHVENGSTSSQRKNSVTKKLGQHYQNIVKALKAEKGSESKQQREQEALNKFSDVEGHLVEIQQLIDKFNKEKHSTDHKAISDKLQNVKSRLKDVDVVSATMQKTVAQYSRRLNEMEKTVNGLMSQKEFGSKFAMYVNSLERIGQNLKSASQIEPTIKSLKELRRNVQSLEEFNETSRNRKKELTQKIDQQIEDCNQELQKQSDKLVVQQLVEDNVSYRKKITNPDKEHTIIDQLANHVKTVEDNFNVNLYANISLLRMKSVLEDMMRCMENMHFQIATKCDLNPGPLSKKYSQSVPKLNVTKSTDQLIKTTAVLKNISTPEVINTADQQYSSPKMRFSGIEEIKSRVQYIKEKIEDSDNKNELKNKLEECQKYLEDVANDPNRSVANSANLVLKDVQEILSFQIPMLKIKDKLQKVSKSVYTFHGTRYDKEFTDIKDQLLTFQTELNSLNIPQENILFIQEKGELAIQIDNLLNALDVNNSSYRRQENEKEQQLKLQLSDLAEKVRRFSGPHRGNLYNSIQMGLNKLLLEIPENIEDRFQADRMTQEVESLLKILEQRSSLVQSFKTDKTSKPAGEAAIEKIQKDLFDIKIELNKTPDNDIQAFQGLRSRLDLVNFELNQMRTKSNENLAKTREICANETQSLKNVVDAKIATGRPTIEPWTEGQFNVEMKQIEQRLRTIKTKVTESNVEDTDTCLNLSKELDNLGDSVSRYTFIRNTDLHVKQSNLLNEIMYYKELLNDSSYIIDLEQRIAKLRNRLDEDEEYDLPSMTTELQKIQDTLKAHKFMVPLENLKSRKLLVQQKADDLAQELRQIEQEEQEELVKGRRIIQDVIQKMEILQPQIYAFMGPTKGNKFFELKERNIRLILQLDKVESKPLYEQKIKPYEDLHDYERVLRKRARDTDELISIEEELDQVNLMIENFSGDEAQLNAIKTTLERIRNKLGDLNLYPDFDERRSICVQKYNKLFDQMITLTISAPTTTHHLQTENSSVTILNHAITSVKMSRSQFFAPQTDDTTEHQLETIERQIRQIEAAAVTCQKIDELERIYNSLQYQSNQLSQIRFPSTSAYESISTLSNKIERISQIINGKVQVLENLKSITNYINDIIDKSNGTLGEDEIRDFQSQLNRASKYLQHVDDPNLRSEVDGCMLSLIVAQGKLKDISTGSR